MAILGYALEYELMTPRGRISTRLTEETFFGGWKPRNGRKYPPDIFLRVDYGCYNVLIFRLLRYYYLNKPIYK